MIRKIKSIVETALKSKIISKWRIPKYSLECHLRELFNHHEIDCVLDVGANEGQFAQFLRYQLEFKGTILSFEPDKTAFNTLKNQSKNDPLWHCYMFALGSEEKTAQFNIMAASVFNSARQPDISTLFKEELMVVDTYDVDFKTLDKIWPELRNQHNIKSAYLKLDTQGFDLEVLHGSEKTFHEIKALQCELAIIKIYQDMPDYKEVISYLENRNFFLSGTHPVSLDKNLRIIEFDGIFVRINQND